MTSSDHNAGAGVANGAQAPPASAPAFPKVLRPNERDAIPLVVSSPHSGRLIPVEERSLYAGPVRPLELSGDLYVDELYAGVELLGATFISSPYSRFVIDLNRLPDDLSPNAVEGAEVQTHAGYYGDRGLIWAVSGGGKSLYKRPLTNAEFQRRLTRYYNPYHDLLFAELRRLRDWFGYAILLDAHSMPSRAPGPEGERRPDVVPGDLFGRSCGPWVSELTAAFWKDQGLSVVPNVPYRGGGIVRQHGRPERGIHAIQLELSRALYMDERTFSRHDGLQSLRASCLQFANTLGAARPT